MAGGDHLSAFERHRGQCFAAAYRMLGSAADAEDTVQDAWLRWSAEDRSDVANPQAYLVRTTTRLALNKLRAARARRESYVGPWLPEPLVWDSGGLDPSVRDPSARDPAEPTMLAESASAAMLVVLETLSPLERAVFVLREVFDYPYEEIASTLNRSTTSVRQLAHRAREHVQARRPRFDTDRVTQWRVTERFLAACQGGDVAVLLELLAPDVILSTDSGGKVRAARYPIYGADKVARFLAGIRQRGTFVKWEAQTAELNGEPGALMWLGGVPTCAMTVGVVDGRVERVFVVLNPEKLAGLPASPAHTHSQPEGGTWNRASL